MKVFISWSGERSRRVAELLRTWVECVIQAVEPWVSSSDIDRGALWFTQIIDELSTTTHGIICLTRENKEKPWILFEAGALAKGLASSRIYTLLVDLNPEDIRDPLAQFNHTRPTEEEMFKLVSSINRGLEGKGLKEGVLVSAFKTYWPQFQEGLEQILAETEAATVPEVPRAQNDILSEILNSVRGIDKRVSMLEGNKYIVSAEDYKIVESPNNIPKISSDGPLMPVEEFIRRLVGQGLYDKNIVNRAQTYYPMTGPVRIREMIKLAKEGAL
jgi:hypothetical protein